MGALAFCVRDDKRDLVFTKATVFGEITNTKGEALAITEALIFCLDQRHMGEIYGSHC